jgi:hypothetical protein
LFPLTIEGQIARDDRIDIDVVAQRIRAEIKRFGFEGIVQGANVSFLNDKNILFQMVKFDRSSQLVDSGAFTIDATSVRYRVSMTMAALLYTTIATVPLVLSLVLRSPIGVLAVAAWWLLVIGMSYCVIAIRVRRALQRASITSPSA